jgi:hypothetical protein
VFAARRDGVFSMTSHDTPGRVRTAAPLGRWNYGLALAGLAMLALGYLALSRGPYDSSLSLTVAPLLLVAAYCIVLPLALIVDPLRGPRSLWPGDWRSIVRDPGAWTAALVGAFAFAVYQTTAARTLTLWDSGELVAASRVLGITHPPGAPLFVLWGRLATMMSGSQDVAARVNHVSVLFATATAVVVTLMLGELIARARQRQREDTGASAEAPARQSPEGATTAAARIARWGGAAVGALALAFSDAQWANALEAEVYAPYLFLTVLVLWLVLRWVPRRHDPGADRLLLLGAYVTGLTLGVHVLHVLALPAMLLILILSQEGLTPARFALLATAGLLGTGVVYPGVVQGVPWLLGNLELAGLLLLLCGVPLAAAAIVGRGGRARGVIALSVVLVLLGFSTYATTTVRSRLDPPIDQGDPQSFARFRSYLAREQYGDWSIADRRAPLWEYQINRMYVRYFGWQFIGKDEVRGSDGRLSALVSVRGLWALPFLLGVAGMAWHFRADWRNASAILALFVMLSLGVVLYVNQEDPQVRERDYSYTGSFMAFALWIGLGTAAVAEGAGRRLAAVSRTGGHGAAASGAALACAAALVLVPGRLLAFNHGSHDRSRDSIGYDIAHNLLSTCAPGAILLSHADNETYPLWALQIAYGVRRDVQVVNIELLNGPWYVRQLQRQPGSPLALTDEQIDALAPLRWPQPQAVSIPVDPSAEAGGQGALALTVGSSGPEGLLSPRDQVLLHLLSANAFRRPVYLSPASVFALRHLDLTAALRVEGLASRLLPAREASRPADRELLRQNLVHRHRYAGFAHPGTMVDPERATSVSWLRASFLLLAESDIAAGDTAGAAATLRQMDERLPEIHLPPQSVIEDLRIARLEWLTGDRVALARRVRGLLRRYALSPHDRMAMATVLWDPLGQRAAADSVATAVLSAPDTPAIDAQSVLTAREMLLGSSTGTDAVSAWLQTRLGDRGGARE